MSFSPFNRKKEKPSHIKGSGLDSTDEKSRLNVQLEEIKKQRQELQARADEALRQVEEIPKQIEERKRRERKRVHERALNHKTVRGLGKPIYKIPSVVAGRKLTRGQQRSMITKFLILCSVLAVLILLLWKVAPV